MVPTLPKVALCLALLRGHPLVSTAVKGIAGRLLEGFLGRVHDQVAFAILVGQLEHTGSGD